MARKRMIDPGYWSDDKTIELDFGQRLLFIGMWNFADDSGVIKNSPKQIKAQIFPADTITSDKMALWLSRLYDLGLILYNKDKTLIKIKGWTDYQKINRPQPSKYIFVKGVQGKVSEDSVNGNGTFTPSIVKNSLVKSSLVEVSLIEKNIAQNKLEEKPLDQIIKQFGQFYKHYPRKVGKKKALIAFKNLSKKDRDSAIEGLTKHIKYWDTNDTTMEFIKHPATWLNGRHWEDVLTNSNMKGIDINPMEEQTKRLVAELRERDKTPPATREEINKIIGDVTNKLTRS